MNTVYILSGIIVSLATLFEICKKSKKQRELELDKKRASLKLDPKETNDRVGYRLHILNSGQSEARNVQVLLDDKPIREHPLAMTGSDILAKTGPNSKVSCIMAISKACSPPFEICITWDDNSREQGKYSGTITY